MRTCSWHGVGNDPTYNNASVFETFPFPEGLTPDVPAERYAGDPRAAAVAKAAKRLDDLRNAWLNPPDLVSIEPEVVRGFPDRILPKDTVTADILRERTLTNLYNQRPQWLADAHRDLDAAVAAAYGWAEDISEENALAKLLELNQARASASATAVRVGTKKKTRPVDPDEARRQPQFKLPITGGKQTQKIVSKIESPMVDHRKGPTERSRRRGKSA